MTKLKICYLSFNRNSLKCYLRISSICTHQDFKILYKNTWSYYVSKLRVVFHINTISGSSLPPVICGLTRVLFTLFLFVCATVVCCVFALFFFIYVASFSELSLLIAPSVFSKVYLTIITYRNISYISKSLVCCKIQYLLHSSFRSKPHIKTNMNNAILKW